MAGLLREIPGTEQLNALPSMAFGRHNALNVGSPNYDPTIEEFCAGSYWPIVVAFSLLALVSVTGIVVAGPPWAKRIMPGYETSSEPRAIADIDDYVQGLWKAVPGLDRR